MLGPHSSRTSSIHLTVTFSSESGVSRAKAMRMTCDLEYERGRRRCRTRHERKVSVLLERSRCAADSESPPETARLGERERARAPRIPPDRCEATREGVSNGELALRRRRELGTHAVSHRASWTAFPSRRISAT